MEPRFLFSTECIIEIMSQNFILGSLLLITFLLAACSPAALGSEDIQASAQVLADQQIASEQAAAPSHTPAPSATLLPTLVPTQIPSATHTILPTQTHTPQPTQTPFGQMNAADFATAKADKADLNAPLVLDNRSGTTIRFVITSPVYQEYEFTASMTIVVREATYTYQAWIGKKGPINGSFTITNGDKHVLSFYEDKVGFKTP
jgi:hypothetical protein